MNISLDWLRDYVDYTGSADELADLLTHAGLNVESVSPVDNDWVLDVEITSNRPDCLGHIGVAREVAALTGANLKWPSVEIAENGKPVEQWTAVANESPGLCRRYTARIIDSVHVKPSPDWMQRRLTAVGLRPISNVVDITNYVLMEIGQPLHAFDFSKLNDSRIVVRCAKPGEHMTAIDGTKLQLKPEHLVIADADNAVALAGVMGGLDSEVSDTTQTVLLESAHFDPLSVRSTSRELTLGSESSFRFERNVDIEMLEWASRRAAALLTELADASVAPGLIDVGPDRQPKPPVTLRLTRLKHLTGIDIETDTVLGILDRLGFQPKLTDQAVTCSIPSWRSDITREADLIEEVIRIVGYDKIPTEHKIHITVAAEGNIQRARKKITAALHGCGFFETVNIGFIEDRCYQPFVSDDFQPLRVKDVTRKNANALRPSLMPSLLEVKKRNQAAQNENCSIYECAAVHQPADQPGSLPKETHMLALLTDNDFRTLRGTVEALVATMDKNAPLTVQPCDLPWSRPGSGAKLLLGDTAIGAAGVAGDKLTELFDLQSPVCLAEIEFDHLIQMQNPTPQLKPLPRFPGVTRDLSLVIDEAVRWDQLHSAITSLNIADLSTLDFVGIYRGKGVPKGQKSLTLSMHFRNDQTTLTHEQVDAYQDQILSTLKTQFNAELRT